VSWRFDAFGQTGAKIKTINPLSPDIKMHIPLIVLHTFLMESVSSICLNIKTSYPWWTLSLFSSLEYFNKYWWPREDEVREWSRVPHDIYFKFIISSHPCREGYFYLLFHRQQSKIHDVILTDQGGVFLKTTTQYDKGPKIDFKQFSLDEAHVWGTRCLPSSSLVVT